MTTILALIKQLREETGLGVMACRNALEAAQGNYAQALEALHEQAARQAAKRANRQASQGRIELYSHAEGRIGVMVEINSETDFTARSPAFCNLAHEVALQIAAAAPRFVTETEIPAQVLAEETQKIAERARSEGKPEAIIGRIVEGSLKKFRDECVLLRQAYIRDETLSVAQLVAQVSASVGENIVIRRFSRWELAEE